MIEPERSLSWQQSHVALPTVLQLDGAVHRVYFTSRSAEQRSHVGWADIDLASGQVVDRCREPALSPGPAGAFDWQGVYGASVLRVGDEVQLWTIGWNVGAPAPMFYAAIGRAVSADGGRTFTHSVVPVMQRHELDPWMVSAPYVLRSGSGFRMWYLSGQGWDGAKSRYFVRHASSADGINWERSPDPCIDWARNVSRACVRPLDEGFEAWFAYDDGAGYAIGRATSPDGLNWVPAAAEVPAAFVEYPNVIRWDDREWLFANTGGFGRDAIALAWRAEARPEGSHRLGTIAQGAILPGAGDLP